MTEATQHAHYIDIDIDRQIDRQIDRSTEIKTYNMRPMGFSFIWELAEDYSLGDSLRQL